MPSAIVLLNGPYRRAVECQTAEAYDQIRPTRLPPPWLFPTIPPAAPCGNVTLVR